MQRAPLIQELDRSYNCWKTLVKIFHTDHGRYTPKFSEPNIAQKILLLAEKLDELRVQTFPDSETRKPFLNQDSMLIFDDLKSSKRELRDAYFRFRTVLHEASKGQLNSSFDGGSNLEGARWTVIFNVVELLAECRGELTQCAVQLGLEIPRTTAPSSNEIAQLEATGT